tara:strand:+ start:124 stop:570 length:447 start_codon:yes stop_codon:yes gene_type:complete
MVKRGKAKRRVTRQAGIKLLNVLESYTYAAILTRGLMGGSPLAVLTGKGDIESYNETDRSFLASGYPGVNLRPGAQVISLMDIIEKPGDSFAVLQGNARNNLLPMAFQSFVTGFSFRFAKRMLRKPIQNVNKNLMAPIFGKGRDGVAL